ncbi:MAG: signal recognition particle receptor subunit alpha [Polyangiaceae bacterium]
MFDTLTKGFRQAMNRLAGLTELTEANIEPALREVRLSLLEADVELGVVKRFLARVKEKAIRGEGTVKTKVKTDAGSMQVSASDVFVKICHDELAAMMGNRYARARDVAGADKPTGIMMVGLQGSEVKQRPQRSLASALEAGQEAHVGCRRHAAPAAVEQLKVLGQKISVPVFNIEGGRPRRHLRKSPRRSEEARQGRHHLRHAVASRSMTCS